MNKEEYSGIEKELIDFSIKTKEVLGISRGVDPECASRVYYILLGNKSKYSPTFSDIISDLDIKLNDRYIPYFDLMELPVNPNHLTEPFLGELIYEKR